MESWDGHWILHCHKNNLNLHIKTEPVTVGVHYCMCLISFPDILVLVLVSLQKPDIYRCIHSCRDRLGFYAESQIIFRTVLAYQYATGRLESSCVCVCCSVAQACDKSSYRDSVKMMNDASEVKIRIREKYIVQITPAFKCNGVWPR